MLITFLHSRKKKRLLTLEAEYLPSKGELVIIDVKSQKIKRIYRVVEVCTTYRILDGEDQPIVINRADVVVEGPDWDGDLRPYYFLMDKDEGKTE
jgi:hypothetical protein